MLFLAEVCVLFRSSMLFLAEVGDYDPEEHLVDYVNKFKMLPKQTPKQEEKIAELHRGLAYVPISITLARQSLIAINGFC